MSEQLNLGSLFSGSGGFELAGSIFGIKPIWNSEIEPFPMRVTEKNFPETIQLGDITKIRGWAIPKVHIITGGSPCQDMSIAGRREGLDGNRSSLFREQIRIVKEMRDDDKLSGRTGKDVRCRWMVWENVPGAFTSNERRDFQAVLTEIVRIAEPEAPDVPMPDKGGWPKSGCLMGVDGGWSVAYRVLDAQYWGVPQRRCRIYLVADFGGSSAPQILLEREGLSRNFAESRKAWERAAGHPEADPNPSIIGGNAYTLRIRPDSNTPAPIVLDNHRNAPLVMAPAIAYNCRNDTPNVEVSATLQAKSNGGQSLNYINPVFQPIPINDKATRYEGGGSTRNGDGSGNGLGVGNPGDPAPTLTAADRHGVCYCIQGSMIGRKDENGPQGSGINEDVSFTLNTIDRHAVVHEVSETFAMQAIGEYIESDVASTCKSRDYKDATDLVVEIPPYIARRYTPLECARLQGFPDWWTDNLGIENPSPIMVKRWAERLGKTEKRAAKWLKDPGSDTSKYKMWGNGVALPCAMFVMEGIAQVFNEGR